MIAQLLLLVQVTWPPGWPPPSGFTQNVPVAGTYKVCNSSRRCASIELREDGKFLYLPNDPYVLWPEMEGRWERIAGNLLLANTEAQPSPIPLVELSRPRVKKLTFCVSDEVSGVPLPEAWISFDADGISSYVDTDQTGCAELPPYRNVSRIEVTQCRYEPAVYEPRSSTSNTFRIRLRHPRPYVTNQKWLVHAGNLYVLDGEPFQRE